MTDQRPQQEIEAHPILYVLTLLVVLNLIVTAWIALRFTQTPGATRELPAAVERIRDEAATKIADACNRRDFGAIYDMFDPDAKSQISEEQFAEPFNRSRDALGDITSIEFSHSKFAGHQRDRDWYELFYRMKLTGGEASSGVLKITVRESEDSFGIMRIDMRSD